eukprot:CAMPEP_0119355672 /NCGR_PEP_ID=MMETSP1334-20130426/4478_1 /TAXON_ID=127549 /ORGANISM="Calcidiscus leptoporus, Strain RCC1130" /LENGTH=45 /DNA_ID= /DNA_START= /DNA_END= /DNA_ORIENTATION=
MRDHSLRLTHQSANDAGQAACFDHITARLWTLTGTYSLLAVSEAH